MGRTTKKAEKKKAVEFRVGFRNYQDPLYFDAKASQRVFIPEVEEGKLTEEQKKIIASFPTQDRGVIKQGQKIETDYLNAALIKAQIVSKASKEEEKKHVHFEDDEENSEEEMSDLSYGNEDEGSLNDVHEDLKDDLAYVMSRKEEIRKQEEEEDAHAAIKKAQKFKPIEGVKFVEYDEHGLPKNDGVDYAQFLVKDDKPPENFMPAPEWVSQLPHKPQADVDKEITEMNDEEKAVFSCMQDEEGEYDELEDDFLFLANEGKVAIEKIEEEKEEPVQSENDGVFIVTGPTEIEERMKEVKERLAAFWAKQGENVQEKLHEQEQVDEEFDNMLEQDYADDQIGELDEIEQEEQDVVDDDILNEALDEYIDENKTRFRKLYQNYGQAKEGGSKDLLYVLEQPQLSMEEEEKVRLEQEKEEIKAKTVLLIERQDKEENEKEGESEEEEEDEEREEQWDCQTIVSTYTNTDNHPGIIKTERRVVKPKHRMELHKQFKVPLEGLMAEEIDLKKEVKPVVKDKPFHVVEQQDDIEEDGEQHENDSKKTKKKQLKEERREKRKMKKELKVAFKSHQEKVVKQQTTETGGIRPGLSVKKIN